jgi:hypothetical protein
LDIEQIAEKYKRNERTIRRYFDSFKDRTAIKTIERKHINLVVDTTYFGRSFGYMIFRAHGVNLHYRQVNNETIEQLSKGLDILDSLGYMFKSVTIDGRAGFIKYLKVRYPHTPLQYCQFHQKQTIRQCITNNPQTACGQELKEFMKDFLKYDYDSFYKDYCKLRNKWSEFMKERNEKKQFKHRMLRRAFGSLKRNMPYLFVYKMFPDLKIPNTTNSCDGYFTHFKKRIKRHCGLKRNRRIKLAEFIIKNS